MIPVLSSDQARAYDRFLAERCGVPSLLLMENAGRVAAEIVHARLCASSPVGRGRRVLCACGPGNNGGDGLVAARHLLRLGHRPFVVLFGRGAEVAPDARVNLGAWKGLGGELREVDDEADARAVIVAGCKEADAVIDALLGTGLSREIGGRLRVAVDAINGSGLPLFSLDVPSGLSADTGEVLGAAIRADVTITFGHPKTGLLTSVGADHSGELNVADLGVPRDIGPAREPRARWLTQADAASWLEAREPSTHKSVAGRVLVIAGSPGKTGAALLASSAALRSGAGLVTIATFPAAAASLDQRVVEVMTHSLDPANVASSLERALEGVDVAIVGPGLGLDAPARAAVDHVVFGWDGPKVIDADAITHFKERAAELGKARGRCLLTPHPGELARLLGATTAQIEADRFGALERAAHLTSQVILLKGPHTLIGELGQAPWVSSAGAAVLATAGAGDVLTGVCSAFAAAGIPLGQAAALAAHVHGRAARRWAAAQGRTDRGLLARDIADHVPQVIAELLRASARTTRL